MTSRREFLVRAFAAGLVTRQGHASAAQGTGAPATPAIDSHNPLVIATSDLMDYYGEDFFTHLLHDAPDSLPTILADRSMMAPLIDALERLGISSSVDNLNDVFREYRHLTMEQGDQIFRAFRSIRQNFPVFDQALVSSGSTNDYAHSTAQLNFLLFLAQKIRNEEYASFVALDNAPYRIVIIPGPDFQFKNLLGKMCGSSDIISDEVNQHSRKIAEIIARHEIAHRKEGVRPTSRDHACHDADIFNRERAADRSAGADQSHAYRLMRFFSLPHPILPEGPEIPTHALANLPDPRSNHYSPLVIAHDYNTASALVQITAGYIAHRQLEDAPDSDGIITLRPLSSRINGEGHEWRITNNHTAIEQLVRPFYVALGDDSSLTLVTGFLALAKDGSIETPNEGIDYPLFYDISRALLHRMQNDERMDQLPITNGIRDLLAGFVEACQAFINPHLLRPQVPTLLQAHVNELPIEIISEYLRDSMFTHLQKACISMPPTAAPQGTVP